MFPNRLILGTCQQYATLENPAERRHGRAVACTTRLALSKESGDHLTTFVTLGNMPGCSCVSSVSSVRPYLSLPISPSPHVLLPVRGPDSRVWAMCDWRILADEGPARVRASDKKCCMALFFNTRACGYNYRSDACGFAVRWALASQGSIQRWHSRATRKCPGVRPCMLAGLPVVLRALPTPG